MKFMKICKVDDRSEVAITGSWGLSEVCSRLESVPLVLESHTSKPLLAKMNAKASLGDGAAKLQHPVNFNFKPK